MALSVSKGILFGDELGDIFGVLFRCGVGGDGGGEPDVPVSFCIGVASACDTEMGCNFVVDFDVCDVVGLSVFEVLVVSVGT